MGIVGSNGLRSFHTWAVSRCSFFWETGHLFQVNLHASPGGSSLCVRSAWLYNGPRHPPLPPPRRTPIALWPQHHDSDNEIRVLRLRGETPAGGSANQHTLPTCRLLSRGSHINSVDRSSQKALLNAGIKIPFVSSCLRARTCPDARAPFPTAGKRLRGPAQLLACLRLNATVAFADLQTDGKRSAVLGRRRRRQRLISG